MKYILLGFALVAAVVANEHFTTEEAQKMKQDSKECKQSSQVSSDVLQKMKQRDFVDDQGLKDYLFCFFKKSHWMDGEGHMQKEAVNKILGKTTTSKEAMELCIDKQGTTGPETAYLFFKCYMEHLPADYKTTT